jgi:hypothetical protein
MTSAIGNADTDENGDWDIPFSGSDPQSVTAAFGSTSKYAYVLDDSGPEISPHANGHARRALAILAQHGQEIPQTRLRSTHNDTSTSSATSSSR